jgi:hypothetical protein
MTLSQVKAVLPELQQLRFQLPDGRMVPAHFHVTEVGKITKDFIDCGGTQRREEVANFQLWSTVDVEHRLQPAKLLRIIEQVEERLGLADVVVEVEYQTETIGKFGLDYSGSHFLLTTKHTDCLAKENCGVPEPLATVATAGCSPGGGCC